jgi:hypothetical protein
MIVKTEDSSYKTSQGSLPNWSSSSINFHSKNSNARNLNRFQSQKSLKNQLLVRKMCLLLLLSRSRRRKSLQRKLPKRRVARRRQGPRSSRITLKALSPSRKWVHARPVRQW